VNKRKVSNRFLSGALGALTTVAVAFPLAASPTVAGSVDTGTESAKAGYQSNTYIVQLEGDPVATYMGDVKGFAATSNRATGANRLNTNSKASKKYQEHLEKKQAKFVTDSSSAIGRSVDVSRDFQIVLNAVTAELSEEEAEALRSMPGVKAVFRETYEVPLTDVGPGFINAPFALSGPPNNVPHSMGEGIVIAILDSGINSDHPSFADVGDDGYDHTNPLGSGNYVPGSYCDIVDGSFCNDKLIGAWDMTGPADGTSPEDDDGHGSHTAATAAGNVINGATLVAPTTSLSRDISGVLPHASIIAYDVCIDSCPGFALLAAIEQVVIDAANLPWRLCRSVGWQRRTRRVHERSQWSLGVDNRRIDSQPGDCECRG
jgi:subtilisin family serine protease